MNALHPTSPATNDGVVAGYLIRIEMPGATYADYERLHAEMAAMGLLKLVVADDGRVFHLPTAEYQGVSRLGVIGLRDAVQYVANTVRAGSQVLVTEAPSMAWTLPLVV